MEKPSIAIGLYQNKRTAHSVLANLKKQGFRYSAAIHRTHHDQIEVSYNRPKKLFFLFTLLFFALAFAIHHFLPEGHLRAFTFVLWAILGIILWPLISSFYIPNKKIIDCFKGKILRGETLVLTVIKKDLAESALYTLRNVESGHPISYLLRPETIDVPKNIMDGEIDREPLTLDNLSEYAKHLSADFKNVEVKKNKQSTLLKNLTQSAFFLNYVRNRISEAESIEQSIPISAEWLIDNSYVIQGNIDEIRKNLPSKYYQELPKLTNGSLHGYPRIYGLARELVQKTAQRLSRENIIAFLTNYQTQDPLTIGELWAFPLMIRLRLVECIRFLAHHIDRRLLESEAASFWGNRLLNAARREPELIPSLVENLKEEIPNPSDHFVEELVDHLFDEEAVLPQIKQWVEEKQQTDISTLMQKEQKQKIFDEAALSSSIVSLINLSQLSWRDVFEEISPVDKILKEDPAAIYGAMDFPTRDMYRQEIEMLAKRSKKSEPEIAQLALSLAQKGTAPVSNHVGYYLIDEGKDTIEEMCQFIPSFLQHIQRFIYRFPIVFYFGGISLVLILIESLLFFHDRNLILAAIALIPASEISLQLVNFLLTKILPPHVLPKMDGEKAIGEHEKTLVVIPMMLINPKEIKESLYNLEIYYLANPDPALRYSLFADFFDSREERHSDDQSLLDCAVNGMKALGEKYGTDKFFLFNRNRVWSKSERSWIGWERKRGKLETLNNFLVNKNEADGTILKVGQKEALEGIQFVITLDSDTQLPKGKARELVATITHPLNTPILSNEGKIVRGYTIIQPRVSSSFIQHIQTRFSEIFSDLSGHDPYSHAVSDIYQDMTREGTYHGKGIYSLHAFQTILAKRFPDEHILSHDLLEGAYARVGFASDIVLFDAFPKNYYTWTNRQHRWMRGDWQILDWLFSTVPHKSEIRTANELSFLNKWKILDNLRRALLPVALVSLFISAWFYGTSPLMWTILGLLVLIIPPTLALISQSLPIPKFSSDFLLGQLRELKKSLISLIVLPHQAYTSLSAFLKVIYRRWISHRHLLEWSTAAKSHRGESNFFQLALISVLAIPLAILLFFHSPRTLFYSIPISLLWLIAPIVVHYLNRPIPVPYRKKLLYEDTLFLKEVARKTWRYFDEFVNPHSNWLPPDNYQAALGIEVAQRTSPTNIGLWCLAAVSAYDFRFISIDQLIDRINLTCETLEKLEKFEGHFLNWYDTHTLKPLYPRYVSTVDSGNFLASLWTLEQALEQIATSPLLSSSILSGIATTFDLFEAEPHVHDLIERLRPLRRLIFSVKSDLPTLIQRIQRALSFVQEFIPTEHFDNKEKIYWLKQLEKQLTDWNTVVQRYFSWVEILLSIPQEQLEQIDPTIPTLREEVLKRIPSLSELASGSLSKTMEPFFKRLEINPLLSKLKESIQNAEWLAGEKLGLIREIIHEIHQQVENTNMAFLYNKDRKLFAIGFQVDEMRLDTSHYDLLASEARISSLVAIAKEDVPLSHWWALGRPYGYVYGRQVLLSWGGTMFEYLMPLLFNKYYPDSLLGNACKEAVDCQIIYGQLRGIPWGISEAAYSEIDIRKTYQYKSFGVPGLGLKRGLEEDLVVSPYSTALALTIKPLAAIENLREFKKKNLDLYGHYGYYESIDFTRQQDVHGLRGVVVYAFMAHHQGMLFLAINNLLNENIMPNRFHNDPRIRGVESLLYEKVPVHPPISKGSRKGIPITRLTPFSTVPIMGKTDTANSPTPKVNLLSNADYSVMITNSGGGYSRWQDFDITRWRSDTTSDNWGTFCYIKDVNSGDIWSSTYHPTQAKNPYYSVSFKVDKVEIKRKDFQIETTMTITVSPEDNAEIRVLTLANLSRQTRHLELTTYAELALAPHAADRAHPAFNKLFIQTEAIPNLSGITAFRRARSPDDKPIWVAHLITCEQKLEEPFEFETDRTQFIGRGGTLQNPHALHRKLTNTQGTVLDPIFSLRHPVILKPGERVSVALVAVAASDYDTMIALMKKYGDLSASFRAQELAWTHAQLDLRHLRIHQEEAQLFQKLASRILYPHLQLRPPTDRLIKNELGQSRLWAYGISGDYPIIALNIADQHEIELVRQALTAHAFWRLRGLKVDLVILNEEAIGYEHPLYEQIKRTIRSYPHFSEMNVPGGIFLLNCDQIPEEDLTLILSVSRANLIAARGSLRQQLVSPMHAKIHPSRLPINKGRKDEPSKPLPFIELPYFNGLGGFTPDGREYVIYLGPHDNTPTPWSNILSNPTFGTIITETGQGTTWYGNSQTNRLTPWSNDPLLNPASEALFIRDDHLGISWSPTPSPIRELDAYRIRHGQNYTRFEHNSHGINQDLLIFVPADENGGHPVKIQKLRLHNQSGHRRTLSIFAYADLVLGTNREETQMHIITEWDPGSQALFIYNRYNPDYGKNLAFFSSNAHIKSYTGDRIEFIGRNNTLEQASALKRQILSGQVGAALDPCAALQVQIEIEPDEQIEIVFTFGYAPSPEKARELISLCRDYNWIDETFSNTQKWWDKTLETLQVETPDLAINFVLNRWLLYQNLSCRIWGRTAFYQSSGAYGFRDQLQDVMGVLYTAPKIARAQILLAASRQFIEGDVQHWWHPPEGGGVRTKISDDLLWLPYVTAQYVKVTQDYSILTEEIPFLKGELLKEDQHELYFVPEVSEEKGTLLEHCRRSIHKGLTHGPHDLPLIGSGDWNDGMNRVGILGKGESIWLGWFLIKVMNDFGDLLGSFGQPEDGKGFKNQALRLAEAIEKEGWDGKWYRRAYFDDGTPIGSSQNIEAIIDSLAQTWAIISEAGNPERSRQAMQAVEELLIKEKEGLVLLLTPPFDKLCMDPGYIKGYPPGVRENGGQYTHGSLWVPLAFAKLGEGKKAVDILRMMHPVTRIHTMEEVHHYKVEPYVLAGDVYALSSQIGRGGWSWYTGSSAWMYRVWIEEIIGFDLKGDLLKLRPTLHPEWGTVKLTYRHKNETVYKIIIENPNHLSRGQVKIELDGKTIESGEISLSSDGSHHTIRATLT